jgi:hypothetical protein
LVYDLTAKSTIQLQMTSAAWNCQCSRATRWTGNANIQTFLGNPPSGAASQCGEEK